MWKKHSNNQTFHSKRLNHNISKKFDPTKLFYDEKLKRYEFYIDETLNKQQNKPDKAGYGIYTGQAHISSFCDKVDGEQTLQNATYQGILHVLKTFSLDEPIIFCLDRKAVIDVMENLPQSYRNKQDALHLDTLNQIKEILDKRTVCGPNPNFTRRVRTPSRACFESVTLSQALA